MATVKPIETKSGVRTSEFWVSLALIVAGIAAELSKQLPEKWGAILATVSGAIYTLSRAFTKANTPS